MGLMEDAYACAVRLGDIGAPLWRREAQQACHAHGEGPAPREPSPDLETDAWRVLGAMWTWVEWIGDIDVRSRACCLYLKHG